MVVAPRGAGWISPEGYELAPRGTRRPRGVRVGVGPEGYELEWAPGVRDGLAPRGTSWSGPEVYELEWAPRGTSWSGPEGYELEWAPGYEMD
jgi:hypothetical protein